MTKAEQVRKERIEKMDSVKAGIANEIFDWMLDILSARTKEGIFDETEFYIYDKEYTLEVNGRNDVMRLHIAFTDFDRREIFSILEKMVRNEEGYVVDYQPHTTFWDSPCLMFKITIE